MNRNKPSLPYGVRWYEGMLLTPQHFQQSEKFNFSERHFWASALSPFSWGIISLDYDENQLINGIFHVKTCKAIFSDGLLYDYLPGISTELKFDLTDFKDEMRTSQKGLVLRVPKVLDPSLQTEDKRFLSNFSTEEFDDDKVDNLITVERKIPNVSLALEGDHKGLYSEIRLIEVIFDGERFVATDFHPPAFNLLPKSKINERIRQIITTLREKTIYLSDKLKISQRDRKESGVDEKLFLFVFLSQVLTELEAQTSFEIMPAELYSTIVRLSGTVSHISNFSAPPFSGNYNHSDIVTSFEPHLMMIESALGSLTRSHTLIEFDRQENSFNIDLSQYHDLKRIIVVIEYSNETGTVSSKSLLDQALISNKEMIDDLRRKRTLGVPRYILTTAERESLDIGDGYTAFAVNYEGSLLQPGDLLNIRLQKDMGLEPHLKLFLYLEEK
jgi:type VI secretion system protein ImpJ